jgi:hypothetical protein
VVEQVQANRQTGVDACGFKLCDRRQRRGGGGGAGRGWLEAFRRFRHAQARMSRAEPFSVWAAKAVRAEPALAMRSSINAV